MMKADESSSAIVILYRLEYTLTFTANQSSHVEYPVWEAIYIPPLQVLHLLTLSLSSLNNMHPLPPRLPP